MNVLAIDTATAACSAALWGGGALRARRHSAMERGHAEALMPMVEEVMVEAGLGYTAIDLIAATVGPGTFTGLRVGLAAARGLALACGVPVLGVTTLEALAHGVKGDGDAAITAALDARRGEIYVQAFDADLVALTPPAALGPAEAVSGLPDGPLVLVGSGAALLAGALARAGREHRLAEGPALPDAAVVAAIAAWRHSGTTPPTGEPPRPLYLRGHGARLPGGTSAAG